MKKQLLKILLPAAVFLAGCASTGGEAAPGEEVLRRSEASAAIGGLFSAYREYSRESFERLLSADFAPSRPEFLQAAESAFNAATLLELTFVLDRAQRTGDTLAAEFTWRRKVQPKLSAGPVMLGGSALAVFKRGNGNWLLYSLKGNDPFR